MKPAANSLLSPSPLRNEPPALKTESIAAWLLCVAVALLILFQVHVAVGSGAINVNLADPFAILAFSAVLMDAALHKRLPLWRVPYFNYALVGISVVMLLGFAHGWYVIGSSNWAMGKVLGWFVLLGYLAAGYLCVAYRGTPGFRRLLETMAIIMCAIVFTRAIVIIGQPYGFFDTYELPHNFEGYAGNRNALAFQILAISAAFLAYLPTYSHKKPAFLPLFSYSQLSLFAMAVMVAGMILTASRSGIATMLIVFTVGFVIRRENRKTTLLALLLGLILWAFFVYSAELVLYVHGLFSDLLGIEPPNAERLRSIQTRFSTPESDVGRWLLTEKAFAVWLEAPLFGRGLGYFLDVSPAIMGLPIVIHNTALWLLTEFGLIGLIPFGFTFVILVIWAIKQTKRRLTANAVLLLLIAFILMSAFHEVLYQRIFWFFLGALLTYRSLDRSKLIQI
ncbi:MAG TPA: O-antigen ligase family protein [Candidimonas sp.]|nr:O-antigen ligase family protein [Candidimonas sp.]